MQADPPIEHAERGVARSNFAHVSTRPRHPRQNVKIVEALKKDYPRVLSAYLAPIWMVCQRTNPSNSGGSRGSHRSEKRPRAPMGKARTRPRQLADQRCDNAYLFGATCPARETGAPLALPNADTEAMQLHLNEILHHVAKGAHAVLLMDRGRSQ